jgi:hypothetical protein
MEATLGISLYSHLYLKLAKTLCLSYYLLCLIFNKIREEEGGTGSVRKCGGGGKKVAQTMYTHVSKCKNNNNKKIVNKLIKNKTKQKQKMYGVSLSIMNSKSRHFFKDWFLSL